MAKIFTKKLNKRGFTLAELLIVVAILAILIAVAIPIYTGAMQEAQKKVNMSNARALRGAATSEILMHWNDTDSNGIKLGDGTAAGGTSTGAHIAGWIAWAAFDANGNMSAVSVKVAQSSDILTSAKTSHVAAYSKDISGSDAADKTLPANADGVVDVKDSGSVTNPNVITIYLESTTVSHK